MPVRIKHQQPQSPRFPWHDRYDPGVPPALDYPDGTLPEFWKTGMRTHENRIALSFMGSDMSYRKLEHSARRLAGFFTQAGLQPGERVLLMMPNMPQFPIAFFAVHLCGGIVVPASPLDTPAEIEYKVRDSEAAFVIFLDLLYNSVAGLEDSDNGPVRAMIAVDIADYLSFPKSMAFRIKKRFLGRRLPDYKKRRAVPLHRYQKILKHSTALRESADVNVSPESPAAILYTGGTTGVSKGVVLSHRAFLVNCTQGRRWVDFNHNDTILCVLPFFHGFGMSMGMNVGLISGARLILMPRFDAGTVLRHLTRDGVTMFAAVPTMYAALIHHPNFTRLKHSKLRGSFVGAAPVPESLKRIFEERTGAVLMEGYGLTETVTANCVIPYEQARQGLGKVLSIGVPWPDTEFKIVDAEDGVTELAVDVPGELLIRTPAMMSGYWRNEEATNETIRDGWLYTGDICTCDADGYFYIVDRKKDLIICGGFNVYPTEIEEALYQHKKIREACVIGIPDEYMGEVPKAFITMHEGENADAEELHEFLSERLIKYKVPRLFEFRPDGLPKSPIGKILRKELRPKPGDSDARR